MQVLNLYPVSQRFGEALESASTSAYLWFNWIIENAESFATYRGLDSGDNRVCLGWMRARLDVRSVCGERHFGGELRASVSSSCFCTHVAQRKIGRIFRRDGLRDIVDRVDADQRDFDSTVEGEREPDSGHSFC